MSSTVLTPPLVHPAFNNIFVEVQDDTKINQTVELQVAGELLERTAHGEKSKFNIRSIISSIIRKDDASVVGRPVGLATPEIFTCRNLAFDYGIQYNGEDKATGITALNAVRQYESRTIDLSYLRGSILTNQKKIVKYPNLPLRLAFLNYSFTGEAYLYYDGIPHTENPIKANHFVFDIPDGVKQLVIASEEILEPLLTNAQEPIKTAAGEVIIITLAGYDTASKQHIDLLNEDCKYSVAKDYERAVYVRWINDIGGYDYKLFDFRQFIEPSIGKINTYQSSLPDGSIEEKIVSVEAERAITVGAGNIDNEEYKRLEKLIYSPAIEVYSQTLYDAGGGRSGNEEAKGWMPLLLDKPKLKFDTRETRQEIEFTFKFPPIQLQY